MNKRIAALTATLLLVAAGSMSVASVAAAADFRPESTIAFTSTRDNLALDPNFGAEVYLAKPVEDGTLALTNLRRLTNDAFGDGFANLSPDGKKIVFESNRLTAPTVCNGIRLNIDDLFRMNTDGTDQELLTRGSSATWSPYGKTIAFHASASYYASGGLVSGCPNRPDAGSATSDSDIFVANVDDIADVADVLSKTQLATNITSSWTVSAETGQRLKIADDPDWSPDGQSIVFTAHDVGDEGPNYPNPPFISDSAEIYVMDPDGTGLQRLTFNNTEERAPAWSPDGSKIVFMCRIGDAIGGPAFEICVMEGDGTGLQRLTFNNTFDGTPTFSPDGQQIVFGRNVVGAQQLFIMNANGTEQTQLTSGTRTTPDGLNILPHWGELRVKV
jgi:Tol biopolymer transport system component